MVSVPKAQGSLRKDIIPREGFVSHRILVIEDDLVWRPMWEAILRRQFVDYHLDWALSSEEAKIFVSKSIQHQFEYSFIVVDVMLAGAETGLDFLVFKKRYLPRTPLIVVSSFEEDNIRCRYFKLVEDVIVLTKPLNIPKCDRAFDKIFGAGTI